MGRQGSKETLYTHPKSLLATKEGFMPPQILFVGYVSGGV